MAEEFLGDGFNPPSDGSLVPGRDREAVRVMVLSSWHYSHHPQTLHPGLYPDA